MNRMCNFGVSKTGVEGERYVAFIIQGYGNSRLTSIADKLHYASEKNQSLLCVGLDPNVSPDANL